MVAEGEFDSKVVLNAARRWLQYREDRLTRRQTEDLVQETALQVWQARATVRDAERLEAFARTIVKRLRYHAVRRHLRARFLSLDADEGHAESVVDRPSEERSLCVAGSPVDADWLLVELPTALARLGDTNRALLQSFYSGSSCREIGGRYGLTEGCVKQRLFRARSLVRADLEARARGAGLVDVPKQEREED